MKASFEPDTSPIPRAGKTLFDDKPPVLAEVRFPRMGTSSDWFLCKDISALGAILNRLGPGAEVHLNSVWDLKNPEGAVVLHKSKQPQFQPHHARPDHAVERLLDEKPPVLVEVRFPKMGISSDWFLCEDAAALDPILDRLGPESEVRVSSVWDLKNPESPVVFRRAKPAGASDRARIDPKVFEPPYERVTGWSPVPPTEDSDERLLEYVVR